LKGLFDNIHFGHQWSSSTNCYSW